MSETQDFSLFVRHATDGTARMDLAIEGVTCAACIREIERCLKLVPGVVEARLNYSNRRLAVDWHDTKVNASQLIDALERIGYHAHPFQPESVEQEAVQYSRWLVRCLGVAGFAAMNVMLLSVSVWSGGVDMSQETRDFFHWLSALIALPAAAYAGQPFFQSAGRALRNRALNMDVPISLGVVLALGLSIFETVHHAEHAYFDSAVMLLFFLLCGRALDDAMRRKTRTVAGNLAALKAEVAHRVEPNGELVMVPAAALQPGDRLLVRPGERIAADGIVVGGISEVDESLVTGETARRAIGVGAAVHAGSLNHGAAFSVRVTAAGGDTLLADVERLLEKATAAKSRYLQLADRAARMYSPVVHAAAFITAIGWLAAGASAHQAIVTAIAVLIITCPCALALAIPAVQVVASGAMFRAGIILNAGDAIERLAEIDTVMFDKTGTLTLPEPRVENAKEIPPELLEVAARLALSSHHPLASAVAREAKDRRPFDGAVEEPGRGVLATVDGYEARLGSAAFCGLARHDAPHALSGTSLIAFSHRGREAVMAVRQTLRRDAVDVVAELVLAGYDIHILSGDRTDAVGPIAAALGVEHWHGGLKPADKIAALEGLKARGRRVLMIGDGLNDAPALAAAYASLSPISAVDITQAQADAVFMGERLAPVLDALAVSRRAHRIMLQNLWLAVAYNAVAVPIAVAGLVTPLIAAVAMSGSSILVTLNALRARSRRRLAPELPRRRA